MSNAVYLRNVMLDTHEQSIKDQLKHFGIAKVLIRGENITDEEQLLKNASEEFAQFLGDNGMQQYLS